MKIKQIKITKYSEDDKDKFKDDPERNKVYDLYYNHQVQNSDFRDQVKYLLSNDLWVT
jgi:hypothetical protein